MKFKCILYIYEGVENLIWIRYYIHLKVSQIGPLPIQTIIKFFAFAIIALGVIFLGEAAYFLFSSNNSSDVSVDNTVPVIEFAKDRK